MMDTIAGVVSDSLFLREGLHLLDISGSRIRGIRPLAPCEAQAALDASPQILDARGMLVLPALIDSHAHVFSAARIHCEIEVFAAENCDNLISILKESPLAGAGFILAGRLNANRWEPAERARIGPELERAFPAKPCLVKSVEQHSCYLNRRAWEALGVNLIAAVGIPPEELAEMQASGRIHGSLYEELATPLYDIFSIEERREALMRYLDGLPRMGVGGVHALVGYGSDVAADIRLAMEVAEAREDLGLVVWPCTTQVEMAKELGLPRIGGCILLDGAVGARTAALMRPYDDCPGNSGTLYFTQKDFTRFAGECAEAGLQLCVHAIGDAAIEQGLRAHEALAGRHDIAALRPRIDHWCLATPEQCERAARLGVASGMQPAFDYYWGGREGAYYGALTNRALSANAIKSALGAGMAVGGGSDAPITPLDPRLGIHAACRHTNPGERLSFEEAVVLFTSGSAALAHNEMETGSLKAGQYADIAIFPGGTNAGNIANRDAAATIHRGRIVHRSGC